jgi:hypothetical protein
MWNNMNKLTPMSSVLLDKLTVASQLRNSPYFMGLKDSLPCSQALATGPYSE